MAKKRSHPAVRFLWVIAGLTVLFIAGALAYRLFEKQLMRWAMVPSVAVPRPCRCRPAPTIGQARLWIARPDIAGNPSLWAPPGFAADAQRRAPRSSSSIRPASSNPRAWNAPIDDPESQDRAALFVRSQASAFNAVGAVWAPQIPPGDVRRLPDQRGQCPARARFRLSRRRSPPMRSSCARRRRTGRSSSPRTARAAPI